MPSSPLKDINAKTAYKAWIEKSIGAYSLEVNRHWHNQDDLYDFFFKKISGQLKTHAGEIKIACFKTEQPLSNSSIKKIGANGISLVTVKTKETTLEGFCIFQTKKAEKIADNLIGASRECSLMLDRTAASYLITIMRKDANTAGAMAVLSSVAKDPPLEDIPYVSFKRFVVEQLLHGIMLEPIKNLEKVIDREAISEIRHVIAIDAIGDGMQTEPIEKTAIILSKLGLATQSL